MLVVSIILVRNQWGNIDKYSVFKLFSISLSLGLVFKQTGSLEETRNARQLSTTNQEKLPIDVHMSSAIDGLQIYTLRCPRKHFLPFHVNLLKVHEQFLCTHQRN